MKKIKSDIIGIEVFNNNIKDGHWYKLSTILKLDYLVLYLDKFCFEYNEFYYDGRHKNLRLGFLGISWGMSPK